VLRKHRYDWSSEAVWYKSAEYTRAEMHTNPETSNKQISPSHYLLLLVSTFDTMTGSALDLSALAIALPATTTNDECTFFSRIPRELRDQIYHYALYEPGGLYYGGDSYPEGPHTFKICTTMQAASSFYPITNWRFDQETASWEYTDGSGEALDATSSEANQLRFVCRQMYAETRTMTVKCNQRMSFGRCKVSTTSVGERFLDFVQYSFQKMGCGGYKFPLYHDTYVTGCWRENEGDRKCFDPSAVLHPIIDFYWANPDIMVDMHLEPTAYKISRMMAGICVSQFEAKRSAR
jgi:hypothetical protein